MRLPAVLRFLVPPISGFIGYGGWSMFCNAGTGMATQSGLLQGSYSLVITLILNGLMERLYAAGMGRLWMAILVCASLYATSFLINYVAGTPHILPTILPGAVLGTFYVWSYVKLLGRS